MTKSKQIKQEYQGLQPYRYADNPLELAFATAWQDRNDLSHPLINYLMDNKDNHEPISPSDEVKLAANTIIQWLGTHVGQCFLRDVFKTKAGIEFLKNVVMDDPDIAGEIKCCCKSGKSKMCSYHTKKFSKLVKS